MFLVFFDGVEAPEGEEDGHFFAGCGGAVGKDKCGEGFVEVVAEEDEGFALSRGHRRGFTRAGFFDGDGVHAFRGFVRDEAVAGRLAPGLGITGKAGVCCLNLNHAILGSTLHGLFEFHNRTGA